MKKFVLIFIVLIGSYTLLRNNVFRLPDQFIWSTSPNYFFKVFLPFFMLISSVFAFFKKSKLTYFYLAVIAMVIDAFYRIAMLVEHLKYKDIPPPPFTPGTIRVVKNFWPSHIMLFVEVILILMVLRLFIVEKQSLFKSSS